MKIRTGQSKQPTIIVVKFLTFFKMAEGGENNLTDAHFAALAASVSTKNLVSIALRYLDINAEIIDSMRAQHRDDVEGLNRDILRKWAYQNAGRGQIQVMHFTMYFCT